MKLQPIWPHRGLVARVALVAALTGITGCLHGGDIDILYKAAGEGNTSQVLALLDAGVDVNGRTGDDSHALHRAAVFNQVETARLLLERGANPNLQNSEGEINARPLPCSRDPADDDRNFTGATAVPR